MGRNEDRWATIESDPGVFTELIEKIGVTGLQVEELWALDKDSLLRLSPVYGLIFLFKWEKEHVHRQASPDMNSPVFFAQQVIPDACATQALLSILLNIPDATPGVQLGPELTGFREFTQELPPDMKGLAISNSDLIRSVHNSLGRPESIIDDEDPKPKKGGDAFHFIAYLPVAGTLYELDGLQQGPIPLQHNLNTEGDWLEAVVPHITARMEQYTGGEVRFNLMAVIADRRAVLQQQITQLEQQKTLVTAQGGDGGLGLHLDAEISSLREDLAGEMAKRQAWAAENIRRRHNYIPLLFNLVQAIASAGQLQPFIEAAKAAPKKQQPSSS